MASGRAWANAAATTPLAPMLAPVIHWRASRHARTGCPLPNRSPRYACTIDGYPNSSSSPPWPERITGTPASRAARMRWKCARMDVSPRFFLVIEDAQDVAAEICRRRRDAVDDWLLEPGNGRLEVRRLIVPAAGIEAGEDVHRRAVR